MVDAPDITLRSTIGVPLAPTQVDDNFTNIRDFCQAILDDGGFTGRGIDSFDVTGDQLTVLLDDATVLGPFTLPKAFFNPRGDWATATSYVVQDCVVSTDAATLGNGYACVLPNTSGTFATDLAANKWVKIVGRGATGPTGAQGFTGIAGPTGMAGITGIGLQGITGTPGITGSIGPTGVGITGAQGVTGTIGVQGITGPQGLTGYGLTGFPGLTGMAGVTGLQGFTGPPGFTGFGFTGSQGPTGPEGGPVGPTGPQGLTGIGLQGPTGVQGFTGVGLQGPTGLQGFTGNGYTPRANAFVSTGSPTGDVTVDWSSSDVATITLSAAWTKLTFSNPVAWQKCLLVITQGSGGNKGIVLPTDVAFGTDIASLPAISTTAAKQDYLGFVRNPGTSTYDFVSIARGF
jgi:hypothetical protein